MMHLPTYWDGMLVGLSSRDSLKTVASWVFKPCIIGTNTVAPHQSVMHTPGNNKEFEATMKDSTDADTHIQRVGSRTTS